MKSIFTVDVSQLLAPKPKVRYMILADKTPEEIIETARRHPRVFIYTFLTMPTNDVPDYSSLEGAADNTSYICMPIWVGNFENTNDAINQIVNAWHSKSSVVNMGLPCEYEQIVP